MAEEKQITAQSVKEVRSRIEAGLKNPTTGEVFKEYLDKDIQSMIGWRIQRKHKGPYPENPDNLEQRVLVYGQRACEIYEGKVILANDIWEDHDDIRARKEIPPTEFRVSGEQFHLKNLPPVPIIRCDATTLPDEDLPKLKKDYVLIDPFYEVL